MTLLGTHVCHHLQCPCHSHSLSTSHYEKDVLSIEDYFQEAKNLANVLATIGQPLSDSEISSYILVGLPSEYESLVTTITTKIEPISIDILFGFLLQNELWLEQFSASSQISLSSANFANHS